MIVDLDANGIAERIYALQDDVAEQVLDDVSKPDLVAASSAALTLYWMLDDLVNGRTVRSPIDYLMGVSKMPGGGSAR